MKKNNKTVLSRCLVGLTSGLIAAGLIIGVSEVIQYSLNIGRYNPNNCNNANAVKMVEDTLKNDLAEQYARIIKVNTWYTEQQKLDHYIGVKKFNYLKGDKNHCLGVAYFTNGDYSNYEYDVYYDKEDNKQQISVEIKSIWKLLK